MTELPKSVLERLRNQAAAQDHPDPDLLTAFSENTLSAGERERMLAHLAACAGCREVVALARPAEPEQPAPVLLPWYRRPQTFTWSAVAATLVIGAALIVNYREMGRSQYSAGRTEVSAPSSAPATKTADAREEAQATATSRASTEDKLTAAPKMKGAEPKPKDRQDLTAKQAIAPRNSYGGSQQASAPPPSDILGLKKESASRAAERDSNFEMKATAAPPPRPAAASPATASNMAIPREQQPAQAARQATAQTVEVQAESPVVETGSARADAVAGALSSTTAPAKAQRAKAVPAFRWSVSGTGKLQRSADSGRTWQDVSPVKEISFRAVAAIGPEIWAGGEASALFHSSDQGQTWSRQLLPGGTATIVSLQFTDNQHGTARCDDGATWTTADGGQHWSRT